MSNSRKSYKPKFKVGDRVVIDYVKGAPGFSKGDDGEVVDRAVKERASDPRQNRYKVSRLDQARPPISGWFDEGDLLTVTEGREAGYL